MVPARSTAEITLDDGVCALELATIKLEPALEMNGSKPVFGHAWSEIQDGQKWLTSDAALAGIQQPVHYVRGGVLKNAGLSFKLGLLNLTNSVSIHGLELSNWRGRRL